MWHELRLKRIFHYLPQKIPPPIPVCPSFRLRGRDNATANELDTSIYVSCVWIHYLCSVPRYSWYNCNTNYVCAIRGQQWKWNCRKKENGNYRWCNPREAHIGIAAIAKGIFCRRLWNVLFKQISCHMPTYGMKASMLTRLPVNSHILHIYACCRRWCAEVLNTIYLFWRLDNRNYNWI